MKRRALLLALLLSLLLGLTKLTSAADSGIDSLSISATDIDKVEWLIRPGSQMLPLDTHKEIELFFDEYEEIYDNEVGAVGLADSTGKVIVPMRYRMVGHPNEGFVCVLTDNEKFGFVDMNGKMVIEPQFANLSHFENGAALVAKDSKLYFIDAENNPLTPAIFSYAPIDRDDIINRTMSGYAISWYQENGLRGVLVRVSGVGYGLMKLSDDEFAGTPEITMEEAKSSDAAKETALPAVISPKPIVSPESKKGAQSPQSILKTWAMKDTTGSHSTYTNLEYTCPYEELSLDEILQYGYFLVEECGGALDPSICYYLKFDNTSVVVPEKERLSAGYFESQDHRISQEQSDYQTISDLFPENIVINDDIYACSGYANRLENNLGNIHANHITLQIRRWGNDENAIRDKALHIAELALAHSDQVEEQLRFVNNYMCDIIEYDYSEPVDGTLSGRPYTAYGALLDGKAKCEGYAHAFTYICYNMKILCFTIEGETHAWNYVLVDGVWRMIDVTWNDTENSREKYFLVDGISDSEHYYDAEATRRMQQSIMKLNMNEDMTEVIVDPMPIFQVNPQAAQSILSREAAALKAADQESTIPLPPVDELPSFPAAPIIDEPAMVPPGTMALPTASTVMVDGEVIAFEAYNIEGSNYFKLRDLAFVLNGTAKQFSVGWDGDNNAISLISGEAYDAAGSEMNGKGEDIKPATSTTAMIYIDGEEASFIAYGIEGNNYFKLRDIGAAFDFAAEWNEAENMIAIDTTKGYDVTLS